MMQTPKPDGAPRMMRDCPKYNTCSVPICPLDADWQKRTLLDNEPVCPWQLESVKPESAERVFTNEGVPDMLVWVRDYFNAVSGAKFSRIRRSLERSALSPSGIEARQASGRRLASGAGDFEGTEPTDA